MIINAVLNKIQTILKHVYDRSFVLQNIDWLIGINILLVILTSTVANSDNIGYFAIFAIILTAVKLLAKNGEILEANLSDKILLIYFILVIISVSGSSLLHLSLKGFSKTFVYLGFYMSVVNYIKDNRDKIKYFIWAFVFCACYETFFAFLQNIGAVEEISGWQDMSNLNPEEVMTRVYGTLKPYNPNLFGGYMLSIIPAFLALPFTFNNRIIKLPKSDKTMSLQTVLIICSFILAILSVIALFLTGCRGAYIGFFFQMLFLIPIIFRFLEPQLKKIFLSIVAFISGIVAIIIISTSSLRARIFSIFAMRNDSSNSFRFNVYHSCLNMFKDNWLLGIGCGNQNFREIYGLYMRTGFDALSAYNIYLETAVESGIFALIAFVLFVAAIFKKGLSFINKLKFDELTHQIFVLAALISIVGMLTHGVVDTVFFRPQIQFTFWIMVGVIRVITDCKNV